MSKSPCFQYYPADMNSDPIVRFWDMERLGCYHAMIDYLWLNSGKIDGNSPEFPAKLCGIFRVSHQKKARKLWENIKVKFVIKDGIITHKRVLKEMQKQAESRLRYSDAGKKGMESRWGKQKKDDNDVISGSYNTPTSTPTPTLLNNNINSIIEYWNKQNGLPSIRTLTKDRKRKLLIRLKETEFSENWKLIIDTIVNTPFLRGENERGWKATFDWIIANSNNYIKVLEGKYLSSKSQQPGSPPLSVDSEGKTPRQRALEQIERLRNE